MLIEGAKIESDVAFFRRRAAEEGELALEAEKLTARDAHLALASRYNDLADAIEGRLARWGMDTVPPARSVL